MLIQANLTIFFTFTAYICRNALQNCSKLSDVSESSIINFKVHHYEFSKPSTIPSLAIILLFVEINQQKLLGASQVIPPTFF